MAIDDIIQHHDDQAELADNSDPQVTALDRWFQITTAAWQRSVDRIMERDDPHAA